MRDLSKSMVRGVMTGALALGLMGTAAISTPVAAQEYNECVDQPELGFFDPNEDNVLTLAELQGVAARFPNNAELQDLVAQANADGLTGIRYDGQCESTDPGNGDGDDNGTTDPGTGNGDGDDNGTTDPGTGNGDGDDNGTTDPGTGNGDGDDNGTTDPGTGNGDGDDNGTTDPGTGNGDGDDNGTTDPGTGNGDGDDNGTTDPGTGNGDGVTELPDTGAGVSAASSSASWLVMGFGSLIAALGAFVFRTKKA